jgi:hypothetical protein
MKSFVPEDGAVAASVLGRVTGFVGLAEEIVDMLIS